VNINIVSNFSEKLQFLDLCFLLIDFIDTFFIHDRHHENQIIKRFIVPEFFYILT